MVVKSPSLGPAAFRILNLSTLAKLSARKKAILSPSFSYTSRLALRYAQPGDRHNRVIRFKMAVTYGVEVFLLVAAWPIQKLDIWQDLCHAWAYENQCFLISCDSAGINRGEQYLGHSAIIDPWSTRIASAGIYEGIVKAKIDIDEVHRIRKGVPLFQDRFFSV